jgi:hypothetical protein
MILQQWNDVMQKVFAQLPGLREKLRGPFEELSKTNGSLVLKMHMAAYRRTITKAGAEIIRRRRRS